MNDDFYRVLTVVAEAFEELNIAYYIGGSLASIMYGMPRSTMDVDVAAEMQRAQVQPFIARVSPLGYIDAESMYEALRAHSSFNIIPFKGPSKIDVFVPKNRAFDSTVFGRVRYVELDPRAPRPFALPSPEDIILLKLEWYEQTNRASIHQWPDVLGVLQGQHHRLDWDYLEHWAAALGVADLLERARAEAGV